MKKFKNVKKKKNVLSSHRYCVYIIYIILQSYIYMYISNKKYIN